MLLPTDYGSALLLCGGRACVCVAVLSVRYVPIDKRERGFTIITYQSDSWHVLAS